MSPRILADHFWISAGPARRVEQASLIGMALVSVSGVQLLTQPGREDFQELCELILRNADRQPSYRPRLSTVIREDYVQANAADLAFHTSISLRPEACKIHMLRGMAPGIPKLRNIWWQAL